MFRGCERAHETQTRHAEREWTLNAPRSLSERTAPTITAQSRVDACRPDGRGTLAETPLCYLLVTFLNHRISAAVGVAGQALYFSDGELTPWDEADLARLVNLPGATQFSVHLRDPAASATATGRSPLDALLVVARAWRDRRRMVRTLDFVGAERLELRDLADLSEVAFTTEERRVLEAIVKERPAIGELRRRELDPDATRTLVYTLLVTRHFTLSADNGPVLGGHREYREALAREARVQFELAEAAIKLGDVARGLERAGRAVELEPARRDYAALLTWARALGDCNPAATKMAIASLCRLLDEDPMNQVALFYRGKLLERAGMRKAALRDFELLLQLNPGHREAASEVRFLGPRVASD